ncbi:MAG: hypothetical protein ACJ8F7_04250 [Gemmataceae bacterium]
MFTKARRAFALLPLIAIGCAEARYVTLEQNGGVVAIANNSDSWPNYNRKHAEELMAKKCPDGYVIDHEEEVVTGQTQHIQTNSNRTGDPLLAALHIAPVQEETHQTTEFTDQREWRIWFHDKNVPIVEPTVGVATAVIPAAVQSREKDSSRAESSRSAKDLSH